MRGSRRYQATALFTSVILLSTIACSLPSANAADATPIWNFKCGLPLITNLVMAYGRIYVTAISAMTGYTHLYCIDASSGRQVWDYYGLQPKFQVENGCIYISDLATLIERSFFCANASTGAEIWRYNGYIGYILGKPLIVGKRLYTAGSDKNLGGVVLALDALTGEVIWYTYRGIVHASSIVYSDGYLYATSNFQTDTGWKCVLYALDASDGGLKWIYEETGTLDSLVATGNHVYFRNNGVVALKASDGSTLWNNTVTVFQNPDDGSEVSSIEPPLVDNDRIYVASETGGVYSLNASDGTFFWHYPVKEWTYSITLRPFIVEDYLYIQSSAGVHCFLASNGTLLWNFIPAGNNGFSGINPAYDNGVFLAASSSELYALNASSGRLIWNYSLPHNTHASAPLLKSDVVYVGESNNNRYDFTSFVLALKSNVTSPIGPEPSPHPSVVLLNPENMTYTDGSVPLDFVVDKQAAWIGYCLDGQDNVTVTGNVTLTGLSDGEHTLTVYANDTFGFMGVSETVTFTVATFPTTLVTIAVAVTAAAVFGVGLIVYFKKRKR